MRTLLTAFLLAGTLLAQRQQPEIDLQAAIRKETVDGDLNGAIKQFSALVSKYKNDRAVIAMALVHMAECYRKMGDQESRKIFEQVVRDYGEQKEAVAMARARLGGDATKGLQTSTMIWSGAPAMGRISSDGRFLSHNATGDLIVREISTGVDHRLTDRSKDFKSHADDHSVISRDNKQVVFSWHNSATNHYDLRLANLNGDSTPRILYDSPVGVDEIEPLDWSPDGKWICVEVFLKDATSSSSARTWDAQIGLVSVPDGSLRVLKSLGRVGGGFDALFFSPDGRYIAYDLPLPAPRGDVFVMEATAAGEIQEPKHPGRDHLLGWSPDGAFVLIARELGGHHALWALPFSNGRFQGAPELLKADIGDAVPFGITRAGGLVYGTTRNNNSYDYWKIQVGSADFEAGKALSGVHDVDPIENGISPKWSPDGKFLAYTSTRTRPSQPPVRSIVIRSADTGELVRKIETKLGFEALEWSPDGRSFIVASYDPSAGQSAYRIDAQSGDASAVFAGEPGRHTQYPVWSPDLKSVYYDRFDSGVKGRAIVRHDVASGSEQEIIRRDWLAVVNLSPDGQYIACPSVDSSTNSRTMLLVPTAGGEPREVMRAHFDGDANQLANEMAMLRNGPAVLGVLWASDSRSFLTFKRLADKTQQDEVWRVFVNGDPPRRLDLTLDRRISPITSLHPDGRRLAYTINETDAWGGPITEVWKLENFLPKGK